MQYRAVRLMIIQKDWPKGILEACIGPQKPPIVIRPASGPQGKAEHAPSSKQRQ